MTDNKKIVLFGGTGYIGTTLRKKLLQLGYTVVLPVRPGSYQGVDHDQLKVIPLQTFSADEITGVIRGTEAVIYNIGIIREIPKKGITFRYLHYDLPAMIIKSAENMNIRRFLLMSANGIENRQTEYQQTKFQTEALLNRSGLSWTIFRPSVVFGKPETGTDFVTELYHTMIRPPVPVPLFFRNSIKKAGAFLMSPVHLEDITEVMTRSITDPEMIGSIHLLGGPETISWTEIINRISAACGRDKLKLPVPVGPVQGLAKFLERFHWFPVTQDQLKMLLAGNFCDSTGIFSRLGIQPKRFIPENLTYLKD